jgi:mannose-6-phosphate isomerase-like protein (cupin superfamily)
MSFYNFKLNDPTSFSTSTSPDSKGPGRFVHKTFQDFNSKPQIVEIAPKISVSRTVMTNDGRGKFAVSGWKEKGVIAPGGEKGRFRVTKQVQQYIANTDVEPIPPPAAAPVTSVPHMNALPPPESLETEMAGDLPLDMGVYDTSVDEVEVPDELHAVSINSTLNGITHTYAPVNLAMLHSLGSPTSIRLVKLQGQGVWHTHDHTDEIFVLLRGSIDILYRTRSGDKSVRVTSGELLRVPMRMEHCVVAEEGTEVLLLEGSDVVCVPLDKG